MKHKFEEPKCVTVEFKPYPDGNTRKPFVIPFCTQIKTDRQITVVYIAKDGREHRHKYNPKYIERITDGKTAYYRVRLFVVNKVPEKD